MRQSRKVREKLHESEPPAAGVAGQAAEAQDPDP